MRRLFEDIVWDEDVADWGKMEAGLAVLHADVFVSLDTHPTRVILQVLLMKNASQRNAYPQ